MPEDPGVFIHGDSPFVGRKGTLRTVTNIPESNSYWYTSYTASSTHCPLQQLTKKN